MSDEKQSLNGNVLQPPQTTGNQSNQHLRFPDMRSGGRALAARLDAFRRRDNVIVLGLLSGGAFVASEAAEQLDLPLDFILIRRLLVPQGYGSQVCAVYVAGNLVIDEELPPQPEVPETPLDYFVADALAELAGREQTCRGGRPPLDLSQKTVILVDCGIRTSSTIRAAIRAVRSLKPAQIVVAVPVGSTEGVQQVKALADQTVYLALPEPFGNVGLWYAEFKRPADEQVSELLK